MPSPPAAWREAARCLTCALLCAFVVLLVAAVRAYPGGSWADAGALGFDLSANYWCDLIRPAAWNGEPNAKSALLARIGLSALGLAQLPLWPLVAGSIRNGSWARALAAAGALAGVFTTIAALTPSDEFPHLHGRTAYAGGALGMLCVFVALLLSWPVVSYLARALALGFLATGGVNMVLWAWGAWFDGPPGHVAPTAQKLATVFFVAWAGVTVLRREGEHVDLKASAGREP